MASGTRSYRVWADYSGEGILPDDFQAVYDPAANADLTPQARNIVNVLWTEKIEEDGAWPGELLNLRAAGREDATDDMYGALLGPTRFDEYVASRRVRDGDLDIDRLQQEYEGIDVEDMDLDALRYEVRPLSTFPAVSTDDSYIVMGVKANVEKDAGRVSFPGAGYLGPDDTYQSAFDNRNHLKPTSKVTAREAEEELDLAIGERHSDEDLAVGSPNITDIRLLGIFEDAYDGAHRNPGMFSIVHTHLDRADISRRRSDAPDAEEHAGELLYMPHDQEVIEDVLASMVDGQRLPQDTADAIHGLPDGQRTIEGTGKSTLMPFLIGRHFFGEDWYHDQLSAYDRHIELEEPDTGRKGPRDLCTDL